MPFDFDGRPVSRGFRLEGRDGARCEARALAVDLDRRLWIADAVAGGLRALTFSGLEVGGIDSQGDPEADRPSAFGDSSGIAVDGVESVSSLAGYEILTEGRASNAARVSST